MDNAAYLLRLRKRLSAKTRVGPGCWEWQGLKDKDGYAITYNRDTDNHVHVARLVWSLSRGIIGDEMQVLHHCDNPACVRLEHLFLGTHTDNMRDKSQKGRWRGNPLKRVQLVCRNCNKPYEVRACHQTRSKFCSWSCRTAK